MENTFKFFYPFKPFITTQKWGVYNEVYLPLGFSRHNGYDANIGRYDWQGKVVSEYPVYCPVEDFRVTEVAYYPKGGGNQIGLTSKEKVWVGGKLCYASVLLCHAKKILVKVGDEPALGELIMIADNTGLSSAIHTHTGTYRLTDSFQKLDTNEMTGSYNPELLFTGKYAVDVASYQTLLISGLRYYKYLLGL